MHLDFKGRTALVTGGTRGIGAAIAQSLVAAGATVTVTGRSEKNFTPSTGLSFQAVDFENAAQTESWCDRLRTQPFDILVNNAGINKIDLFHEVNVADFDRIQLVNVRAPMLVTRSLVEGMARRGYGRIVNISSIFGNVSKSKRMSYSTSKFALLGMTKTLALDYADRGVLANCVSPGFIDTELTRSVLGESGIAELVAQVPMKRLGKANEIARVVTFLASEQNSFITGQDILADGGFTVG